MVTVTNDVGLTLVVVDKDTLSVPVLQSVLLIDELGVEERDGERVGDPVKVVDPVGVFDTLAELLKEAVTELHVVGEPDWLELVHTVTVLLKVPEAVLQLEAETLPD